MFRIMVVEDDVNSRRLMQAVIEQNGYEAIPAADGVEALELMDKKHVDLIVLDVMMPRMDGYALAKELRSAANNVPILMVTARQSANDKREGFLSGTDDYMVKPVDEEEMMLRISALFRRSRIVNERKLTIGSTTLDYDGQTLSDNGGERELPPKEFMLLYKLLSYPNHIFTRRQLMDEIWDMESNTDERTVDVHINRLREKLKANEDIELVTVRGLGYKAVKRQ